MKSYTFDVPVVFVMSNEPEQRVCIKFCIKLGKSVTETFEMIKKEEEKKNIPRQSNEQSQNIRTQKRFQSD